MADSSLKAQLTADMKAAMKAKDKERLGVIRLMLSEFKRVEVDDRIDLSEDPTRSLGILDKMLKQRVDSMEQFTKAGREDLAQTEAFEIEIIKAYMPTPLSPEEVELAISQALEQSGAQTIRDLGKVMGILKPKLQGRADIGQVSSKIKERLDTL